MRAHRGSAPLFLLVTFLLACATGVGVYLYLKDRNAHAKVSAARIEPVRPEPAPSPVPVTEVVPPPEPVEPPPVAPPVTAPDDPLGIPEELPADEVEATLAGARAKFADCAVVGNVKITLKIRPSGRVEQVTIDGADSDEMRACLVSAAKRVKFAKSAKGLTTRYTLVGQ